MSSLRFLLLSVLLVAGSVEPVFAADRTPVILGTATPGGGFELYGGVLAEEVNKVAPDLNLLARNTRGSRQNIPLLEQGTLDVALVASLPAREAFEGIKRDRDAAVGIWNLTAFPNPLGAGGTRFLFQTNAVRADGRIQIYSVSGRTVATIDIPAENLTVGQGVIVSWDGRDGVSDELANGVYLYVVSLNTAAGPLKSEVQRLVIMR